MIASFTSRSNYWQPSRNDSTLTARTGAPCFQPPDNRIASSEQGDRRKNGVCPSAELIGELPEFEEFKAIIFLRVPPGRPSHQQGEVPRDLMLLYPVLGKIAPAFRIVGQLDRLHTIGE